MLDKKTQSFHPMVDPRPYRHKNAVFNFLCPLCGVERQFTKSYKLSREKYIQIVILSGSLTLLFYPVFEFKGLIFFPVCWALFEFWARINYRKDIACPHCGFDAAWYKKDVPYAKQLVHQFWGDKVKVEEDDQSSENISSAEDLD